ncbi:hypothetical protein Xbud_02088 [Xenorhabdus budapestensis]|uniref:Uncharacterized protein n=1 Tax=Xenorhabdus budapestensis TaxID=290110 RepID=A0A2D0J139_XENBU|nr:hypothetical protein Xbud_02088 [Xenorhabdus budapestensis]
MDNARFCGRYFLDANYNYLCYFLSINNTLKIH